MKARCIATGEWFDNKKLTRQHWWSKKTPTPCKGPKLGDIVTVLGEVWSDGEKYYKLLEWANVGDYNSKWFEPLEEKYKSVKYSEIRKEEKVSVN